MTREETRSILIQLEDRCPDGLTNAEWVAIGAAIRHLRNPWHSCDDTPNFYNNMSKPIVSSYYDKLPAVQYSDKEWELHIEKVKANNFKWAYQEDLI